MKTQIKITGQVKGNSHLRSSILGNEIDEKRTQNGFLITFKSKKDAVKSLSEAWKYIKSEEPEFGDMSYLRAWGINYDASYARIINEIV